ncbi:MAG TPA: universal stress protein [Micromonosporaceae bacterium]
MTGERIVVGVDGSPSAGAALRWALDQARLTGAAVDALIAWEFPLFAAGGVLLPPQDPESAARRVLDAAVADAPRTGVEVRCHVEPGHPAQALVEAAEGAGLLVVGSRGRGTFKAALLGSVAAYCVQHAPCPVVVVRGR